ncbi:hypothetical protein QYF36_013241 [Acer negundo]|nr:hypothetical protein QYF36_013241 [Acer negundo]
MTSRTWSLLFLRSSSAKPRRLAGNSYRPRVGILRKLFSCSMLDKMLEIKKKYVLLYLLDTWANEAVSQTVVLVIDPITGQKMRSRCGMAVQPENLLEDLVPFMDCSLRDHLAALSHKCTTGNSSTPQDQNTKDYSSASGVTLKLKQVT